MGKIKEYIQYFTISVAAAAVGITTGIIAGPHLINLLSPKSKTAITQPPTIPKPSQLEIEAGELRQLKRKAQKAQVERRIARDLKLAEMDAALFRYRTGLSKYQAKMAPISK